MNATADWQRAENVLCVRLDALGDVLMTTPALRALKQSHPGRRLTLLTSPAAAALAPLVPEIDDCIIYDAPWMKATAPRSDSKPDFAMIHRLQRRRFNAAVIFTVFSQNPLPAAMLCLLADIPRRLAHCRENPYQLLTDWVQEPEPGQFIRHEVRRQLDLVTTIGCRTTNERLSLSVPLGASRRIRSMLHELGLAGGRPWILIHPGASAPSRRYPAERFTEAAELLASEHDLPIVFSGSDGERELIESIRAAMGAPSHSLAGRLSLAELAALVELAPVLITNNTGPAHIAAAVGTPVVDLYAQTNPQHTPWQIPQRVLYHDVPCKNCFKSVCPQGHHDCLARVPPDAVARAALELLASRPSQQRLPLLARTTGSV
ncbi:MAG TPA: lipopolysaccharide heptosyltransferase II [Gemmataceae bacterium]|nr:lipopolysaccharide heptosyltransferase II [Gemmataceae bacterium]